MLSLSLGKKPIVVPRYHRYGEHVDDHQLELVDTLTHHELIIPLFDGDHLSECIELANHRLGEKRWIQPSGALVCELHRIIRKS
jgi:UDP-N-acetylglucosamine transferase subunit ALG13